MPICSLSGIENCNNSHVSTYNVLTLSTDCVASNSIIKTTLYITGHVIRSSRLPVFFLQGRSLSMRSLGTRSLGTRNTSLGMRLRWRWKTRRCRQKLWISVTSKILEHKNKVCCYYCIINCCFVVTWHIELGLQNCEESWQVFPSEFKPFLPTWIATYPHNSHTQLSF